MTSEVFRLEGSPVADVQSTLEYGHSHDLARTLFPATLVGIAIGLFLLTSFDGSDIERGQLLSGGALIALSIGFLAMIVFRLNRPSIAHIVLSPRGILFTGVSQRIIPWNEVREVGVAHVRAVNDFSRTKVTKIVVSQRFYNSITRVTFLDSVVAKADDPSEIYLSYFHRLPFDEFHHAVQIRWRAFSHHASNIGEESAAPLPTAEPSKRATSPRDSAVRRVNSIFSRSTLIELGHDFTRTQKVVSGAALIGILVLATNILGFWSTVTQREGRTAAAEWRAKWERFEADRRATDADQRRVDEMWDQKF